LEGDRWESPIWPNPFRLLEMGGILDSLFWRGGGIPAGGRGIIGDYTERGRGKWPQKGGAPPGVSTREGLPFKIPPGGRKGDNQEISGGKENH